MSHPEGVTGPDATASGLVARLRAQWKDVTWFVNGVRGANAYEHYLAHHYGTGCEHEPLTEREFWKAKLDDDNNNPQMRCC